LTGLFAEELAWIRTAVRLESLTYGGNLRYAWHDYEIDVEGGKMIAAYVAPFVLFALVTMIESSGWLGLSYEIVYTVKTSLIAVALWTFRRHYPPFSTAGFRLAVVAGATGCLVWIVLAEAQSAIPGMQQLLDAILPGTRVAYDPFSGAGSVAAGTAFVSVRLLGLAVVVPLMEEVFWRGFLARYLIADNFCDVPQGKFTRASFLIVTAAFALVHPEILAAVAWGAMINVLYRKTANLWACVVMHAVTNGLLGAYILATGNWQLW
jgi:uncharacterized protein